MSAAGLAMNARAGAAGTAAVTTPGASVIDRDIAVTATSTTLPSGLCRVAVCLCRLAVCL